MKTLIVSLALGAGMIAAPALAQARGGDGGWMQRDQTRANAQQRAQMMFQMLDGNHDGTVTKGEADDAVAKFEATQGSGGHGGRSVRGRMMQRMIDRLFATTPSITQQQFEDGMLSRFDAMDLNHDGTVTAAERQQYRQQRRGAHSGMTPPAPIQPPQ